MPISKQDQVLLFREQMPGFYNKPKMKVVTGAEVKQGRPIGITDSVKKRILPKYVT